VGRFKLIYTLFTINIIINMITMNGGELYPAVAPR
jgi:hypothetical protein